MWYTFDYEGDTLVIIINVVQCMKYTWGKRWGDVGETEGKQRLRCIYFFNENINKNEISF